MEYHVKYAKSLGNFVEAGRLLIYACGRIIHNHVGLRSRARAHGKMQMKYKLTIYLRIF